MPPSESSLISNTPSHGFGRIKYDQVQVRMKKRKIDNNITSADHRTWENAQDQYTKLQESVATLEEKLNVQVGWSPGSRDWEEAKNLTAEHEYVLALNRLEVLVVARLFEMSKQHQSGTGNMFELVTIFSYLISHTGYAMRQAISKALSSRQQAIQTAITIYNDCAAACTPPRPTLDAKQLLDYAYLGDFELLRHSRHGILDKPWAKPLAREVSVIYFKLERAKEEVKRLNVELKRLTTYMTEEEAFLHHHCLRLTSDDPLLSLQVHLKLTRFEYVNGLHRAKIATIEAMDGFSGDTSIGRRNGIVSTEPRMRGMSLSEREEDELRELEDLGEDDDDDKGLLGEDHDSEAVAQAQDITAQSLLAYTPVDHIIA